MVRSVRVVSRVAIVTRVQNARSAFFFVEIDEFNEFEQVESVAETPRFVSR